MSGRHVFTMLFIIAALSILAVASAPDAHAAGLITVTNTLDETTNGDGCSLREAISNANNNAQTYTDCTSGSGADTINFSVSGTITLTSMLPAITDNVTIDGTGQAISVSGGDSARVMQVNGGKTLHLTNIVITHGKAPDGGNTDNPGGDGGGLYNSGTAIITGSTFSYNASGNAGTFGGGADGGKGGAIFNAGTLNVSNSLFDHNSAGLGVSGYNQEGKQGPGGAIYNLSQLTVTGSTFSNNDAGLGGGIENFGATATVSGTTFTGNTADLGGGFSNYFGGDLPLPTVPSTITAPVMKGAVSGATVLSP